MWVCEEESRYSLVVVCSDCLPGLEVEVLYFPVSCCCSEVLQYFHCLYRPGLNQSMLCSVPAFSSLPVSNVYHVAGGIAVFLGWQHSSSRSSPIWELPCLNQAFQEAVLSKVLPFSEICFLPEAWILVQVLPFWWKDARHDVERGPITVMSLSRSGMSTGVSLAALRTCS